MSPQERKECLWMLFLTLVLCLGFVCIGMQPAAGKTADTQCLTYQELGQFLDTIEAPVTYATGVVVVHSETGDVHWVWDRTRKVF